MHSSSAALLTGKYFTKPWSFLLHFTVCLSQWFFFCKLFTMICFLQPNPKVINAVLHSASSSQSSTIQTFIPEVLHSLLECGFSAFSWVHFVLSCVVKSCIWYLNGEHCKTTMLKGLLLFISLLFPYLSPSGVFPLARTDASCYSCHLQVFSLANCLNAKSLHTLLWEMILQNLSILEQCKK